MMARRTPSLPLDAIAVVLGAAALAVGLVALLYHWALALVGGL